LEIRLSKEKELLDWLEQEIKRALHHEVLIPDPLATRHHQPYSSARTQTIQPAFDLRLPQKKGRGEFPSQAHDHHLKPSDPENKIKEPYQSYNFPHEGWSSDKGGIVHPPQTLEQEMDKEAKGDKVLSNQESLQVDDNKASGKDRIPLLSLIGQLLGTYILAQNEEGLYLIDQHAAQERIWYEYYLEQLKHKEQPMQMLAVPLVLEFTAGEAVMLEKRIEILQQAGLSIENFGHHAYMVRSYPVWFPEKNPEVLLREIIDHVIQHKGEIHWLEFRDDIAKMACKRSIKANRYLTRAEMEALLEKLRDCTNPFTCPHGRPVTVRLSKYEIEKMFKRVM
jgi:DNA mismatch repair protein MutL